jgi:two-component system, NtrC family, sensor kinase
MIENVSILVAEDNQVLRKSMCEFLQKAGYFVTDAATGAEALNVFRDIRPHLVITDLRMPELDGLEFLRIANKDSPQTPFIIVSGAGTMEDVIHGLRLGAWDYLTKPIYPMELLKHAVEHALERSRLVRQNLHHQQLLEEVIEQRTAELSRQNQAFRRELEERKVLQEQADEARNEWERTMNALPDMIAIVDLNRHIVRLNQAMQEKIGKPFAEIIGQPCFMCTRGPRCPHQKMLETGKALATEIFIKEPHCHFSLNIIPYYSAKGKLIGSVHILRDITEQRKNQKEKEILQAQLLQAHKLESVGQLAAGIAHEINTPTQFVSSNVGFLSDAFTDVKDIIATLTRAAETNTLSPARLRDALNKADWPYLETEIPLAIEQSREGLIRVTSIVRAMKEFSHPGGKEFEQVDINHLIEITVTVARNEWKYGAEVVLKLASDLPGVSCLANAIGQTLLNLLVNAAHAITEKLGRTPEGGKGTITITTASDGASVTIAIADTGCGIPESIQGKIFDPFFTTKDVGKGTGQGLAIAYDVITRKHGGKLGFTTVPGEGTTFTISLPIKHQKRRGLP